MRAALGTVAVLLAACGSAPPRDESPTPASAPPPVASAASAVVVLVVPDNPLIAFDESASYVVVQGKERALLGDLRSTPARWRSAPGTYDTSLGYQAYDLPADLAPTHPLLHTVHGGFVAVHQQQPEATFLEDLRSGERRSLPLPSEITDSAVISHENESTIVRPFDGGERRYAGALALVPQQPDLLVGRDDESTLFIADALRPERLETRASWIDEVKWVGSKHAHVVISASAPGEPRTLRVLDFPSGAKRAELTSKNEPQGIRASDDGALVAWTFSDDGAKCGASVLHVATGRVQALPSFPCVRAGQRAAIVSVAADAVVVGSSRFNPTTGRPLPPGPKPAAPTTPLDRSAFRAELVALSMRGADLTQGPPLQVDAGLLHMRHGYEVVGWGNAKTVLVRSGSRLSLCNATHGEDCHEVGDLADKTPHAAFSPDGRKAAIACAGQVLVIDGTTGAVLASVR